MENPITPALGLQRNANVFMSSQVSNQVFQHQHAAHGWLCAVSGQMPHHMLTVRQIGRQVKQHPNTCPECFGSLASLPLLKLWVMRRDKIQIPKRIGNKKLIPSRTKSPKGEADISMLSFIRVAKFSRRTNIHVVHTAVQNNEIQPCENQREITND